MGVWEIILNTSIVILLACFFVYVCWEGWHLFDNSEDNNK